jgi:hypothetical protein
MVAIKDETGMRYGSLMVIGRCDKPKHLSATCAFWECLCDCGNKIILSGTRLRSGKIISCGHTDIKIPKNSKECPSYPGYWVTKDGDVYSQHNQFTGSELYGRKTRIDDNYCKKLNVTKNAKTGYYQCSISVNCKETTARIHCMILDAFVGPRPTRSHQARHLDGNKEHNYLSNLAWGTSKDNADDRKKHGTYYQGEKHPESKLTDSQALEIILSPKTKSSSKILSKKFGVSINTIKTIRYNRKSWCHLK